MSETYIPGADDSLPDEYLNQSPAINPITGTLGKAFDTFLDALAIGGANKIVGSVYPTGQQNPAAVASAVKTQEKADSFNWKPYAIAGGALVAGLLILAVLRPRSE